MECGSYQTLNDEKTKKVMPDPQHRVCIADEAPLNQRADQSRVCREPQGHPTGVPAPLGNHRTLRSELEPTNPPAPTSASHRCAPEH